MEDPTATAHITPTQEELKVMVTNNQRARTRYTNVNKHIDIANAIVRKAQGKNLFGRKLHEWRHHNQEADRLIRRYEANPIA